MGSTESPRPPAQGDFELNSCANLLAPSFALKGGDALQKMTEEATKRKQNTKSIKGVWG